ncbi:MAG: dephospho-CoA kinase, partial [Thermodesulfobacteriota bacterium]
MKIIGLTGNIASGKTEVANIFKDLGAKVIDADQIAREIVKPGEVAWLEITDEFGREILNSDGTINRQKLGEIVFNDKLKREKLNRITHPTIIATIKERIETYEEERVKVVIIEAALIVEKGGLKDLIDDLIVVTADRETQIKRIISRDGLKREEALSRIKSQMPATQKIQHATHVIDNSGTLAKTKNQVEQLWKKITTI